MTRQKSSSHTAHAIAIITGQLHWESTTCESYIHAKEQHERSIFQRLLLLEQRSLDITYDTPSKVQSLLHPTNTCDKAHTQKETSHPNIL
jgi:hypothetical protein